MFSLSIFPQSFSTSHLWIYALLFYFNLVVQDLHAHAKSSFKILLTGYVFIRFSISSIVALYTIMQTWWDKYF